MKRVLLFLLTFQFLLSGILKSNAQTNTLGFSGTAPASAPSGSGPTTSSQTVTFHQSQAVAAPPGASFTPTTQVTFSLSNQQFSSLEGNPTIAGMQFAGLGNSGVGSAGNTVTSTPIWAGLGTIFGGTYAGDYTGCNTCTVGNSSTTATGDGVRYNTLGSIGVMLYTDALIKSDGTAVAGITDINANGQPNLSGSFYYGDLTITFNRPVSNPVIHFADIGGYVQYSTLLSGVTTNYIQGFTTDFTLLTSGVTLAKLSGNLSLSVTPTTITNSAALLGSPSSGTTYAGQSRTAAAGSVVINGENITSVTFSLNLRGDGGSIRNSTGASGSASSASLGNFVQWAVQGAMQPCHGTVGCTPAAGLSVVSGDYLQMAIGLQKPVNVSGHVWHDADAGNVNSSSAVEIPSGIFANLVDNNGNVVASQAVPTSGVTAGQFSFAAVGEGTYTVSLSTTAGVQGSPAPTAGVTSGWASTGEYNGASNSGNEGLVDSKSEPFTVTTIDVSDRNFGIRQVGSISGNVSIDTNGDDVGENNLSGVTLTLYNDVNNNGVYDSGTDTQVGTTTTDGSGNYSFLNLPAGNYVVVESQPAGYSTVTDIDTSSDTGGDLTNSSTTDNQIPVGLGTGEIDANNNFVERSVKGSISGNVSADSDFNDVGDVNLPSVTLNLYILTNVFYAC